MAFFGFMKPLIIGGVILFIISLFIATIGSVINFVKEPSVDVAKEGAIRVFGRVFALDTTINREISYLIEDNETNTNTTQTIEGTLPINVDAKQLIFMDLIFNLLCLFSVFLILFKVVKIIVKDDLTGLITSYSFTILIFIAIEILYSSVILKEVIIPFKWVFKIPQLVSMINI